MCSVFESFERGNLPKGARHSSRRPGGVFLAACLLAFSVGFLLWGCGGGDSMAGNSVETENSVSARKLPVDSILPHWNRPAGVAVATVRFDAQNFDFGMSSADGHDLRFEQLDGSPIPFAVGLWDSTASMGRVLLRIDTALRHFDTAAHAGASVRMSWGFRQQTSRSNPAALWKGVSDSEALLANSILAGDFEDGTLASHLPDGVLWQASADTIGGLKSCVVTSVESGKAVHITYQANHPHYVVFSVALANDARNLRSFDSLVLRARGNGNIYLSLEHLVNGVGPKAWKRYALNSTWNPLQVNPSNFDSIDVASKNLGWDAVRDSVTHLTFILSDGTDAWLDDIRLYGINRDDLR